MKHILTVICLALSLPAFATPVIMIEKDLDFFHSTRDDWGNEVYYSCDYVEDRTESILENLGATDIEARCSGGLQDWGFGRLYGLPINLDARYMVPDRVSESPELLEAEWVSMEISDWGSHTSCELNVDLISAILKTFPVANLQVEDRCHGSSGKYSFTFDVLKLK